MTEWYSPLRLALAPAQETELDPMAAHLKSSAITATRSPRHDRRYEWPRAFPSTARGVGSSVRGAADNYPEQYDEKAWVHVTNRGLVGIGV